MSHVDPYLNASHTSDILPSRSPSSASLAQGSKSLTRNTLIRPSQQKAYLSTPKAHNPLYCRQGLRLLGAMCMVSARSLLTTCDCVNMRFYRLNLGFCVNYDSNYNSTSNLKQAILTKSFCCVPYHVSVPVLKHYYLYEIRRVIWNSSAKCAVQGNFAPCHYRQGQNWKS